MFNVLLTGFLCVVIAYLGIRLSNTRIELIDLRIRYYYAQKTIHTIVNDRTDEVSDESHVAK